MQIKVDPAVGRGGGGGAGRWVLRESRGALEEGTRAATDYTASCLAAGAVPAAHTCGQDLVRTGPPVPGVRAG